MSLYDILCICSLTFNVIQMILCVVCIAFFAFSKFETEETDPEPIYDNYKIINKYNGTILASGFTSYQKAINHLENHFGADINFVINDFYIFNNDKLKSIYPAVYDRLESRN